MVSSDSSNKYTSPHVVWVQSPEDHKELVKLGVSENHLRDIFEHGYQQNPKLGQYCGLIHGNYPENVHKEVTPSKPVAIFRGLKRPRSKNNHDDQTLIYVTNPQLSFNYISDQIPEYVEDEDAKLIAPGPVPIEWPSDQVFTTLVDYGPDAVAKLRKSGSFVYPEDISGVVCDWDWVYSDPRDIRLPKRYDTIYAMKLWDEKDVI